MRYLCRLVTPPGAALEGFRFIGVEQEPDFFRIAERRIAAATDPLPLAF